MIWLTYDIIYPFKKLMATYLRENVIEITLQAMYWNQNNMHLDCTNKNTFKFDQKNKSKTILSKEKPLQQ